MSRRIWPRTRRSLAAAALIGGPQIRHMGTLGGNLCQRNRCWYFRDEHVNCLLKGGRKCFAQEGENQYHAIFTQGHPCVIVNPSSLAPALIALGATAEIMGPKGKRELPVEKLYQAPAKENQREHVLAPNEMLVSVTIPVGVPQFAKIGNASYEVRQKETSDWPLVQAAVAFHFEKGSKVAQGVRVVLGHVAPMPMLSEGAAKAIGRQGSHRSDGGSRRRGGDRRRSAVEPERVQGASTQGGGQARGAAGRWNETVLGMNENHER